MWKYKQAEWVAYEISPSELDGEIPRLNYFKIDPQLKYGAKHYDYTNSDYQRGHLCPADIMAFSEVAMQESFYTSNISPQLEGFNEGIWRRLENQVQKWVKEYDTIYVITGPVFINRTPKKIGECIQMIKKSSNIL